MKTTFPVLRTIRKWLTVTLPVGALTLAAALPLPAAHADAAGVLVNNNAYFTVDEISLSKGSDTNYLQFALKLQNDGSSTVNMNDYGVKVTDADGHSFSAQLAAKESALVAGGGSTVYRFSSQVPVNDDLSKLQVGIFKWNYSADDLMDDLGSIPAAQVTNTERVREVYIEADQADTSLPSDAELKFYMQGSYLVNEDDQVYLYTDLYVKNLGSSSYELPSALKYRLYGTEAQTYEASVVSGSGEELLPNVSNKITLRTALPLNTTSTDGYSLQLYTSTDGSTAVLGMLDAAEMNAATQIGQTQTYAGKNGMTDVSISTANVITGVQSDGLHLSAAVTVRNNGATVAKIPALSASFQFGTEGSAVTASDSSEHPAYLTAGDQTVYHFSTVLPEGLKAEDVKLVLLDNVKGSSSSSSSSSSGSSSSGSSSSSSSASSSTTDTSTDTTGTSSSSDSSSSSSSSSSKTSATNIPVAITALNGAVDGSNLLASAKAYTLGDVMPLETGVLSDDVTISLVEFHVNDSEDDGFQTAVAKYKITNNGQDAEAFPDFSAGLLVKGGAEFTASRQSAVADQILPNSSYVVSYAYTLPDNVPVDDLALNVTADNGDYSIGTYQVSPQPLAAGDIWDVYPFQVQVNSSSLSWLYSSNAYTYQLALDVTVNKQEQILIDANFPTLEFDLVDSVGRVIGTTDIPFTGTDRLVNGKQIIKFSNVDGDQINDGVTLRVYEKVPTANGDAKRLIQSIVK